VNLSTGANTITVVATDGSSNPRTTQITITRAAADTTAPALSITSHTNGQTVTTPGITLAGTATDNGAGGSGITSVTVNSATATGGTATGNNTASWSRSLTLASGANIITVVARDGANNPRTTQITINYSSVPPLTISSLTGNPASPQIAGTSITFTAAASGGTAPHEFKWFIWTGTGWVTARDWGAATYTWTPTVPNPDYRIGVWARSAGSSDNTGGTNLSIPYPITSGSGSPSVPLTLTSLSGNVASPQAPGMTITFTAAAAGSTAPYQFKWFIFNGTSWAMVQDWTNSATHSWTPTVANANYRVGVWARSAGSTDDSGSVNLSIPYPIASGSPSTPLRLTGITSNAASPQRRGTTITFTATATGATAPYQYKWFIFNGTTWTMVRNWSNDPTYSWSPTQSSANYRVGVWARSAGSSDDTGSVNLSIGYQITP
jgi:hypothetical protein